MRLNRILREKKEAILDRWLQKTLATYAKDSAGFFGREKDQFANPVGHALSTGMRGILEGLLTDMDPKEICAHLNEIIKIRAIQDFSPSQAVSFVFHLKGAIRDELAREIQAQGLAAELGEIDAEIDQMALFAFDVYSRCREQVYELRVNEVKRSVSALMGKFCGDATDPEPVEEPAETRSSKAACDAAPKGDAETDRDHASREGLQAEGSQWQGGGK